jgi:hypothetical protein
VAEIYSTGTEYVANEITITRGTVGDITAVGVFHTTDPAVIPTVAQFTTVTLADGTAEPPDTLSEPGVIDVLSLIGPRGGQVTLSAGDYQRFILISTATEDIIRRPDTLTVL